MIYSILPFLALSVSALNTSPASIKNAKNSFHKLDTDSKARVNKQVQSKLEAVPIGFGAKLAKFHGARGVASSKKVDLTAIDTEVESNHLRALHMRDNFLQYNMWTDAMCTQSQLTFGSLVNHCANEMNKDTGEKRSTLVKVNKKTNTVVELTYEGYDCKGIPTKVDDIGDDLPEFKEFGECFYHESTDDSPSAYYSLDYLSTYPDRDAMGAIPDTFATLTYQEKRCTDQNKNYFEFSQFPLDMLGIDFGTCMPAGDTTSVMYDKSQCANDHQLYFYYWLSADCSGDVYYSGPLLSGGGCNTNDDDGDDNDDDDYDDDGFDYVNAIANQYCT